MVSRRYSTFILLLLAGCQASPPMLANLIERHTAARGGKNAIEAVQSIRIDLQITEPGSSVRGEYVATRDGFMRIDIYAEDERVFTESLGPDGGWQLMRGEQQAVDLSDAGESALRRGVIANLYGLHELPSLGYSLSVAPARDSGGQMSWAIDTSAPDGFVRRQFLNPATFLIDRTVESSALHPDLDSAHVQKENRLSDYRAEAGVMYSRQSTTIDLASGDTLQTVVVREVQVNPVIDSSIFGRPE